MSIGFTVCDFQATKLFLSLNSISLFIQQY
jgi:hypothetical protein